MRSSGVRQSSAGGLVIANPIYREVIPTSLASIAIASLPQIQPSWLGPDGHIDETRLLEAFLAFWRQHGEPLFAAAPYHEIAPHLVLMAFLHRVVNGGGSIEREYAIGSGRMDILVQYRGRRLAIELKVWHDDKPDPRKDGLEQLDRYLAGLGLDHGWLVIFDRRTGAGRLSERTMAEAAVTMAAASLSGHGSPMFTGELLALRSRCCELAASLRHVHGFPVLGLLRRLRPIPGSSADGAPARLRPGWAEGRATRGRFPRSPCTGRQDRRPALPLQPRHTYAAGFRCGLLPGLRFPGSESPRFQSARRALLPGPHPPGWSRFHA